MRSDVVGCFGSPVFAINCMPSASSVNSDVDIGALAHKCACIVSLRRSNLKRLLQREGRLRRSGGEDRAFPLAHRLPADRSVVSVSVHHIFVGVRVCRISRVSHWSWLQPLGCPQLCRVASWLGTQTRHIWVRSGFRSAASPVRARIVRFLDAFEF
jgi:hypothetical protein